MSIISETIRYLGYGKSVPDKQTEEIIIECIAELQETAEPKIIFRRYPITYIDNQTIESAGLVVHSKNLGKNLKGCDEILFLAATLGVSVDRLLKKYMKLHISKAAIFQSAAAAFLEEYCNNWQKSLERDLSKDGLFIRPRFSPGYGDFSLEYQSGILQILEAQKRIGLVLTEGNIMLPEKSITAVIGISKENKNCHIEGCEVCSMKDCQYRRN